MANKVTPPSFAMLRARARALVPSLRARATEAETLRRIPDETIADLHKSGLFRMLQPQRVGGSELPYRALVELGAILAEGCGSTAWVVANLASHHWMLAMWPEAAQNEVWGVSPDDLIGSALVFPSGKATAVTDGYMLSGRWPFSSGVDPSRWNFVGGIVHDAKD
ncbi:MAG TPA: acyl-CoA dehydrogenase family protein, partial [Stellaceae bacterium]|nr:acyl-CoA dehydrogenase family protein [Stellaceae bacterium]